MPKKSTLEKAEETIKSILKGNNKKAKTTKKSTSNSKTKVEIDKKSTSKSTAKKSTKTSTSTKKELGTKKVPKSVTSKKVDTKKSDNKEKIAKPKKQQFLTEYYDLPSKYDKTIVTILSQTPTNLFVYWEISDETRDEYRKKYGENFFAVTSPILIVYNDTLNYSFEVDINDFANSWYIHVNDPDCTYRVELGRKPLPIANNLENNSNNGNNAKNSDVPESKQYQYIPYYVYITSSNNITFPNNKILFNFGKTIKFRNVKTGNTYEKSTSEFKFITNLGIYNINELYKSLYQNEDLYGDGSILNNPSSGLTSSRNNY